MNTRLLKGVFVFVVLAMNAFAGPAERAAQWAEVEKAEASGQPKTAMEKLDPIISGAYADLLYAEAIRAVALKMAIEDRVQGNGAEQKIVRFQTEVEKAPAAMKPAMEAILAHWYWQYYQQNRWRFMQRTQTAESPGGDIKTWDLARILAEIDKHFTAALADDVALKKTAIYDYRQLLESGDVPDSYRPTLFDFLAYEALKFYQSGEHAQNKAEDEFEMPADGPVFADASTFLAWHSTFATKQFPDSPIVKALDLFGRLMTFHAGDASRDAYFDADLARLEYGKNIATGDDKIGRYKAALQRFIVTTASHGISARATAMLAAQLNSEGEPAKARELALRGLKAFPASVGGSLCYNLIQQIEAKSAQLNTESVWNAPWPTLDLTYRNVTKIYFRAYALDFAERIKKDPDDRELLKSKHVLEWDADLPTTTDFKERTEKLPAPKTLKPGYYLIAASHDRTFSDNNNQVSTATVWVSDLALVLRLRYDSATQRGLVVRAGSGEPVSGAFISIWKENRSGDLKPDVSTVTDDNGCFEFSSQDRSCLIMAEAEGQAVATPRGVYASGRESRERAETQTVFFTDRAIYRPGQTVNYKGVSIRYDREVGKYSSLSGQKLTVVFNDPNGKEIARAEHRTNDYGSFSGTFTAPRDRLMGRMTIQVLGRPSQTSISVEEYKRPKFQVEIITPAEAAKLDAPVVLTGKAVAYNGAAIGGAKVKWRVERGVQLPYWCWWWQPPASKAIAHGTVVTEPDGTFKIEFPATPDRSVPTKNEPVFVFTLHADVTDTTGETRSADRAVRAGYTALQATLTADDWQTPAQPVELSIATNSLNGDPQAASGIVTIYALKQPVVVERVPLQKERSWWNRHNDEPEVDPTNPDSWPLGEVAVENNFTSDVTGKAQLKVALKTGIYRILLVSKDRFGKRITARRTIEVLDPAEKRYGVKVPNLFAAPKWSVEPGEAFTALWGTGYDKGRAFVEIECNGQTLQSYWTVGDRTQDLIKQSVKEDLRGGFTLRVTYIKENRAYVNERVVNVPWSNKQLAIKWESFRSKLTPGQKEIWTAVVTGPDAKHATAEMVATLYDASLDQYLPHHWPQGFGVFRVEQGRSRIEFQNTKLNFGDIYGWAQPDRRDAQWRYSSFVREVSVDHWIRYGSLGAEIGGSDDGEIIVLSPFSVATTHDLGYAAAASLGGARSRRAKAFRGEVEEQSSEGLMATDAPASAAPVRPTPDQLEEPKPDLSKVTARKNLNETAFFFPQLTADENGVVRMTFTMPEALTEWKFLGFAHDKQLRSGLLTDKITTSKDLMVEPNPPRFVREGDAIEFTVKVSNQSEQPQKGTVKLAFADAASLKSVDDALGNRATEQAFDLPAKQSRSYSWRIAVPDGLGFVTYKAVAATTQFSDGEEGFLPVLSRRILVTESLPLPIRGKATKQFEFAKLLASAKSDTLRHQSLTVQMTSQPAWYAVMALPYLMEFSHECSEQLFNRFYSNALARHIANSDPKIRRIFDLWKNTPALDSPLEKNQDLKAVMLEETPWWREATTENQARRNVGLLFDGNRLDEETERVLKQLGERQQSDGLWAWFPGGHSDEFISLYIATGFGRLRHLGVQLDSTPAVKAFAALDGWMVKQYLDIQKNPNPEAYVPAHLTAIYLYGRSFFLKDQPVKPQHREAIDFFIRQAKKFWLKTECRMCQAQLALALQRFGDPLTPQAIMKSLKERSVSSEELGMFWCDAENGWWWYQAPIETQATMIEAFAEVADDAQAVEDCKVWLLKQKQTQNWETTKATADAIYGLLLRGNNLLASDALVEVSLAGEAIKPEKVEAGTGFYEQKFVHNEIKPAMGQITVKKTDDGVSWGSVHWQYLEDVAKITAHESTPLKLEKTLWVKEATSRGQVLKPVAGPVAVGDEIVVRIELRVDRDMEYVHLKDQRGSGTEPINVLSQYKYQDGLAYYESTRDTASHFFISYLPKGTYVFEYSIRVQLKGAYQTGIAEIQCMYAPEFNSHSESIPLEVK